MAHNVLMPMKSLLVNGTHRLATCWKITRADAVTLRFTDHDRELVVDSEVYSPTSGPSASARQRVEGTTPQNLDVRGAIVSSAVTEQDLRVGKYRDAVVTEFVVDWLYPFSGKFLSNTYRIDETTNDGEAWQAKLVGQLHRLTASVGDQVHKKCRWELGDANCGVNLATFTVTGSVVAVTQTRRKFTSGRTEANGWFDDGKLTFTSGLNNGLKFDVKAYINSGGTFELQVAAPFDFAGGNTFSVYPGCLKRIQDCRDKFNNVVNNGGFPFVPGTDELLETADAR